jgi:thymidylate synthase (FAD)
MRMKIVPQSVELEGITPHAAQVIERAGRTCYKSEGNISENTASKFVKMIITRGHESVLEHAYASFRVITDRGVSHEFVRHRLASYSQESTRYCNYGKTGEILVIEPPGLESVMHGLGQMTPHACWLAACQAAEHSYLSMIEQGVSPQIARSVLPTCLKTEFVATANFREWRHFIKLRTSAAAHPQMREVAVMIKDILVKECPEVFGDFVEAA